MGKLKHCILRRTCSSCLYGYLRTGGSSLDDRQNRSCIAMKNGVDLGCGSLVVSRMYRRHHRYGKSKNIKAPTTERSRRMAVYVSQCLPACLFLPPRAQSKKTNKSKKCLLASLSDQVPPNFRFFLVSPRDQSHPPLLLMAVSGDRKACLLHGVCYHGT